MLGSAPLQSDVRLALLSTGESCGCRESRGCGRWSDGQRDRPRIRPQRIAGYFVRHRAEFLDRAIQTIEKNLEREVAKNKITAADKSAALERIVTTVERAKLAECDFVVEAATEKFEIKAELFRDLDRICRPEVILASNTSSISITKLGALSKRPDKVIGMHFFNPVPVMKLVEVIRGLATSDETFQAVRALAVKLGKT